MMNEEIIAIFFILFWLLELFINDYCEGTLVSIHVRYSLLVYLFQGNIP